MGVTNVYRVTGMTCDHCVQAVTTELSKIDGVAGVDVDLESGDVKITSTDPLDVQSVQGAVDEAGFELVP